MSTASVTDTLNEIPRKIRSAEQAEKRVDTLLAEARARVADIPTAHAADIAEINTYDGTNGDAFEKWAIATRDRLVPEFQAIRDRLAAKIAAIDAIT